MSGTHHSDPSRPPLRLVPAGLPPLPVAVPLLHPDRPVTAAEDALLTGIARRARLGDAAARDLLWRACAPKLEPALRHCERMTWRADWVRRDGRPWEQDDLRQEAWLVFADLTAKWRGEGSFTPYVIAYFAWRLRNAMRRLGPPRNRIVIPCGTADAAIDCPGLADAETAVLLAALLAALSPLEAEIVCLRVGEGLSWSAIALRLRISPRTVSRRLRRIRRVAETFLKDAARMPEPEPAGAG